MAKKVNKKEEIKIMVGSTVYGFEDNLSQVVATLKTLGYNVINSSSCTVKVDSDLSNLENCLLAVEECDLFLGIIRPYYGTGNIDGKNITFEEFKKAIELKKPYWFLVHRDVTFARKLLKKIKCKEDEKHTLQVEKNDFFDDRCIEIYEYVTKNRIPIEDRNGNWAQEFNRLDEMLTYINTQFSDKDFIDRILSKKRAENGK
jgi:hypothetical protein